MELFLCSSLVAYWRSTDLGGSPSIVISVCLFIVFMGSQRKNTKIVSFPSPVDHVLSGPDYQGHAFSSSTYSDDMPTCCPTEMIDCSSVALNNAKANWKTQQRQHDWKG